MSDASYKVGDIPGWLWPPVRDAHRDSLKLESRILERGHKKSERHRNFREDSIWDRNVAVLLRDDTVIPADMLRQANSESKVLALVAWSPYGKSGSGKWIKWMCSQNRSTRVTDR